MTGSYRSTALSQAEPSRVCSHSGICGCRAGCRAAEMAGVVRSRSKGVGVRADGADSVARSSLARLRKRGGATGRQADLLSAHTACRRGLDCVGCRACKWSLPVEPGGPGSSPCTYATDLTARGSLRCAGGDRGRFVLAGHLYGLNTGSIPCLTRGPVHVKQASGVPDVGCSLQVHTKWEPIPIFCI